MTDILPPIAVLLKEARGAYGVAIHHQLTARGFDAVPPNGAFVLGALHHEASRENIEHERGRALEKGQTIAQLVAAGYLLDDGE
jgi:hypothetical protein